MKKKYLSLLLAAGFAWVAQGQVIFDSSVGSYTAGDLAGQENWAELLITSNGTPVVGVDQLGSNAFNVDNSNWITPGADAAFLVTTNGSYVYLDEASVLNDVFDELTYEMEFKVSLPGRTAGDPAVVMANDEFIYFGITSSTTNGLSKFDSNDALILMRTRQAEGNIDLNFQNTASGDDRILRCENDGTNLGWDPGGVFGTTDFETDKLKVTVVMRKTGDAGTYTATATLSNTVTGTFFNYANADTNRVVTTTISTDLYASSTPVLAIGRPAGAYNDDFGFVDIDIDSFKVSRASVAPAVAAPSTLMAAAYDDTVTLNWDAVPEAASYKLSSSTSMGGPYTEVTNINALGFADSGLAFNIPVYYVVQADFGVFGLSTNSMEATGTPLEISTGTIIDTSFTQGEGYSNGDLADQLSWKWATGSDSNALNIVNHTTTGEASTIGNNYNAATNLGNAVYLDKLMDNNVDDTLQGEMDFVISSQIAAGTNIALILNQAIFTLGLTSDENAAHNAYGSSMALLVVRPKSDGNVEVNFADTTNGDSLAALQREAVGWDPEDEDANGVTADDLITDSIHLSWSIRKTSVADTYQAQATLSTSSATNKTATYVLKTKAPLYAASGVKFTMGQYNEASKGGNDVVNTIVESMSLTHTNSLPIPVAVENVVTIGSDRTVTVSWDEAFESTGYEVFMSETLGGEEINISGATTNITSFVDTPRFNGVTNYYKVRSHFVTGNENSDAVAGVPTGGAIVSTLAHYDGWNQNYVSGDRSFPTEGEVEINGLTYLDFRTAEMMSSTVNADYSGPTLHGIIQENLTNQTWLHVRIENNDAFGTWQPADAIRINAGNGGTPYSALVFMELGEDVDLTADQLGVRLRVNQGSNVRVAIRSGTQWYVSEQTASSDSSAELDITDVGATNWAAVATDPATLLADPASFTVSGANFTQVNAAGLWNASDTKQRYAEIKVEKTVSGSIVSTEYWMNQYAGVSNLTDNTDGDALSNIKEYAYGGNPEDANDVGTLPEFTAANYMGTNGFTFVNVELRDPTPGVDYSLETTGNLAFPSWGPDASITVIGESNVDYYFKAVTNFIPADAAAEFIDLKVTEAP